MGSPVTQTGTSPLTQEQWEGLARLGDLGNRLGTLMDGPLSGPSAAALDRIGSLDGKYDLGRLAGNLIATVHELERAGVLDLVRDNAQFAMDSMHTLQPIIAEWIGRLQELPADELKADLVFALSFLRKARTVSEFVEERLAGEIAGKLASATEFMQSNQTDEAIGDLLVQLGRIHRSGLLVRLGDLAEYLAGIDEGTNLESQLGSLVGTLSGDAVGQWLDLARGAKLAMAEAGKDGKGLGGYLGMLRLVRDKNLQKSLRMLALLPSYLDEGRDKPKSN